MLSSDIFSDLNLVAVLEASKNACEQANLLADLISQTSPSHTGQLAELAKQQKLLLSNLGNLRGLYWAAHFAARETKAETLEKRQEVDRLHLQLQNLYYEQRHLQGEITACESYDHTYQELPLIDEEDFLERFPEHRDDDERALMEARIEHERLDREALEQQRQELLKRKQKLIAENKKRKEDLANVDEAVIKFIATATPVDEKFKKIV